MRTRSSLEPSSFPSGATAFSLPGTPSEIAAAETSSRSVAREQPDQLLRHRIARVRRHRAHDRDLVRAARLAQKPAPIAPAPRPGRDARARRVSATRTPIGVFSFAGDLLELRQILRGDDRRRPAATAASRTAEDASLGSGDASSFSVSSRSACRPLRGRQLLDRRIGAQGVEPGWRRPPSASPSWIETQSTLPASEPSSRLRSIRWRKSATS